MYYTVSVTEGRFNIMDPSEVKFSNSVRVYNDDGGSIEVVSVTADEPIFNDNDEPEDIAQALEEWLDGMFYTSDEEKIRNMIQFLRKHSKELLKGKLRKDIERIEAKIKELNEEKERLRKQYEEILVDGGEGNEQKVKEDGFE